MFSVTNIKKKKPISKSEEYFLLFSLLQFLNVDGALHLEALQL